MPSALQSQLASQLGGSHTHVLHKQPPSLIFGKKQAAQIDKDSLLSIARTGLLDLINSEDAFKEFESSLFSDKHRDINRSLMVCILLKSLIPRPRKKTIIWMPF